MYGYPLGEFAGMEWEMTMPTEQQAQLWLSRSRSLSGYNVHHDGSTQDQGYTYPGLPYNVRSFKSFGEGRTMSRRITTGAEVVSPPTDLTNDKWRDQVKYICDWLVKVAHEVPSFRTSFHVHISAPGLPVYVLKNMIRLWTFLEAPIYRLSVGELGIHRGVTRKQFSYCRPLSAPPIVFDQDHNLRPSFDVRALLNASTTAEFFWGYGASDVMREPMRWHPARYSGFNPLSALSIQTVEFRTFNESLDPETIMTWVDLSKAFVDAAVQSKGLGNDDYPILPLGYNGDFDLGSLQVMLELPDKLMARIERLWFKADWQAFNGLPLFNSNNDNSTLNWPNTNMTTLPPVINGTPVMCYAPGSNGRRSEDKLMVFSNYDEFVNVNGYMNESEAIDLVQNWSERSVKPAPKKGVARPVEQSEPQVRFTTPTGRAAPALAEWTATIPPRQAPTYRPIPSPDGLQRYEVQERTQEE